MELKFKQETFSYYEAVQETPFSFETTQETIIPDYCADAARVVDAHGCALLHSKELLPDGRLELSGVIKATILFLPEGSWEVCALHVSLPIHTYFESKNLSDCAKLGIKLRLKNIDARLLNPRKLLTRAETEAEITFYHSRSLTICTDVAEREELGLEVLQEHTETTVVTDFLEREFTYVDELNLSASKAPIREILYSRSALIPGESRVVGSKLVLKGLVRAELFYKDRNGELGTMNQEFLFSQILASEASEENCLVRSDFELTGYEYIVGSESNPDDGHTVTMKLHIRSAAQIMEKKTISFLSDMYSTAKEVKLERQVVALTEDERSFVKKHGLREMLSTATAVKDVVYAAAECGSCRCQSGERGSFVEVPVRLRCLYLDMNDALLLAEKEIAIKAETEIDHSAAPRIRVSCAGEVSASPAPDGVDTRFTLEFFVETGRKGQKTAILRGEAEESSPGDERIPSLVLRKFDQGMRLWDIAKLYRATTADILAANGLEEESAISADRLLLIPRHK